MMKWIHVNENYLDYLRNVEKEYQKQIMGQTNISHSSEFFLKKTVYII